MIYHFYLLPSTTDLKPVYLFISHGTGKRFRYNTGLKIDPVDWDKKKERLKGKVIGSAKINNKITKIEDKLALLPLKPTIHQIKEVLYEKVVDRITFFDFCKELLKVDLDKRIETTINHLTAFNRKLDFKNITADFYNDFVNHLAKGGMVNNSIGTQINKLKKICKKADKKGLMVTRDWEDFVVLKEKVKKYTVSSDQMLKLYKREYIDNRITEAVDLFVFRFFAGGLRHGDSQVLKEESIINVMVDGKLVKALQYSQVKTDQSNCVALNSVCLEILKKYKGVLPKMTSHNCNRYLKKAFKACGYKDKEIKIRHSGKKRVETVHEMWELLGKSHTARYSAVRMIVEKTGNVYLAKEVLGHSDVKTTQGYMEFNEELKHKEFLKITNL